jgi:ketosteroid isomerase-like protein
MKVNSMTITTPVPSDQEANLIALSKQKWVWMAERNVEALAALFHENAIFVHMGATMTKETELKVISDGTIEYKQVDIDSIDVHYVGDTAIVASQLTLHAIVMGNVAENPFSVTETYTKQGGDWVLGALAFTKRLVPDE